MSSQKSFAGWFQSDTGSPPESPLKPQKKNSPVCQTPPSRVQRPSSVSAVLSSKTTPDGRRSLDRRAWLGAVDDREKERERWRQFRETSRSGRPAVLRLQLRSPKARPSKPSEPSESDRLVLSEGLFVRPAHRC